MTTATVMFWKDRSVVYRCYDADDRLLYVGNTVNMPRRWREHVGGSWWVEITAKVRLAVFPHVEAARAAEAVAIQEEQPIANIVHSGRQSSDKSRPLWTRKDLVRYHEFCTRPLLNDPRPYFIGQRKAAEVAYARVFPNGDTRRRVAA